MIPDARQGQGDFAFQSDARPGLIDRFPKPGPGLVHGVEKDAIGLQLANEFNQ
jgi:hypothetical protein